MFSHATVGISDFERAFAFYRGLMDMLGHKPRFSDAAKGWAGWQPAEGGRPLFVIVRPFDGGPAAPGNGQMIAFLVPDRATVDRAHAYALEQGATDEGAPGLRPQYHPDYYGAYFRDPDGNKLCVVCHAPARPG
ncbi:MAG TPA: VOC family protein [Rhizomicrobium sp.]|jgi:lactoylglutathione lyase|nr:VOC family protein [Rhizomicrobium sp.]